MQKILSVKSKADFDCIDITQQVESFIRESKVEEGSVIVFSKGSTAAVTTLEYKEGVIADLKRVLERIAPKDDSYEHKKDWGDDNGFSHILSALLKPSVTIPFKEAKLLLGTWQQIVLLNFDTKDRQREVILTIVTN